MLNYESCFVFWERDAVKKKKKTVFIKSGAANINMTFDISALKRRRWAASHALLSNPLSDNSSSQNTAGFSATCSIQPGSLTSTIVPNEKQWIRQAGTFCFIYLFFQLLNIYFWWRTFSSQTNTKLVCSTNQVWSTHYILPCQFLIIIIILFFIILISYCALIPSYCPLWPHYKEK